MLCMNILKKSNFQIGGMIIVLSVIPLFFTWGKLAIGGDTMIPFDSLVLEKYLHQWIGTQNGQYFSINYYPLYFFYKLFEFLHLDIYLISSAALFLLNVSAGYGIYYLSKLFSVQRSVFTLAVPVFLYLFSPALLNGWHYLYIYSLIPWLAYFIFKVVRRNSIEFSDVAWMSGLVFFYTLDLPNPKYLFHLFVVTTTVLILSHLLKIINFDFFKKNIWKLILFILSLVYLVVPLAYFSFHYSPEAYGIHIKSGYKDKGEMMDAGSATMDKMFRLHHNGLNLNYEERLSYLTSDVITVFEYLFIFLIVGSLLFRERMGKRAKYVPIFFVVILEFLFLAAGPNPPFGSLYQAMVERFSFLAFLRTTAGAVFFLSLFYSISLFVFLEALPSFYKKLITPIVLLATVIVSYPLWNGEFYQNNTATNQFIIKGEQGVRIPSEYFDMKNVFDRKKLDAKVLVSNIDASYMSTMWGYFGPPIYHFLFKSSIITPDKIYSSISAHNVGFILADSSTIEKRQEEYEESGIGFREVTEKGFLTLLAVPENRFLPHVYIPERSILSRKNIDQLRNIVTESAAGLNSAIFFLSQVKEKEALLNGLLSQPEKRATLEFKKVSQTKYRVRIHGGTGKFPLVFSEGFHDGWKLYVMGMPDSAKRTEVDFSKYKILNGNEGEQATREELMQYIDQGAVTDLGNGKEKQERYREWQGPEKVLDLTEKYTIDFVSKNFQGTIQNDNLSNGVFWETWFKTPLQHNGTHLVANGYSNSWILEIEKMCIENQGYCQRNMDGTYDFEVVIEFWPQRIFLISAFVSGAVMMLCIGYAGICVFRNRRKRSEHDRIADIC